MEEITSQGMDAGFPPPGKARETARGMASSVAASVAGAASAGTAGSAAAVGLRAEGTTVAVPDLPRGVSPRVRLLTSIEATGATIDAAEISATVTSLPDGTPGVRVSTTNSVLPAGLYVGMIEWADQQRPAPVQLYLSRAEAPTQ